MPMGGHGQMNPNGPDILNTDLNSYQSQGRPGNGSEKSILENNFISNQNMIMNQKMLANNLNAQRKNLIKNAMLQGKPDQTHSSKDSESGLFGGFTDMRGQQYQNFGLMNRQYSQGTGMGDNMMGGGGVYGGTPTQGMTNPNSIYGNSHSPSMGGLGLSNFFNSSPKLNRLDLEGGLYKNDFGNQPMLNNGQNLINMNMQQQMNLNNNNNINNLFSHPSEETYSKNYKQYNLTDQNDFRGVSNSKPKKNSSERATA
jgi:hypothetical protein